jgi:hypothetical protein
MFSWWFSDEAQEAEAKQVLGAIFDIREQQEPSADVMTQACHALSMLFFILHETGKVRIFC